MSSMVPCAPSNMTVLPSRMALLSSTEGSETMGRVSSAKGASSGRRWQRRECAQQRGGVDDQSIADHGLLPGTQDAARDQFEDELLVADENRMARIVPALIARHNIEAFREEIDDLAFALVAPL